MTTLGYWAGACWYLMAPTWRAEQAWRRAFWHARDVLALVGACVLWATVVYLVAA